MLTVTTIIGLYCLFTGHLRDTHGAYKLMWGWRLVAFNNLYYAVAIFMGKVDIEPLPMWLSGGMSAFFFVWFAVKEYQTRNTFNLYVWEDENPL